MKKRIFFFVFALISAPAVAVRPAQTTKQTQRNLSSHVHSSHAPEKTNNTCMQCNKTFESSGRLAYHLTRIHTRQKALHTCTKCGKQYKNKASFDTHESKHTGDEFMQATSALTALGIAREENGITRATSDMGALDLSAETPAPATPIQLNVNAPRSSALNSLGHGQNSAFKPYKR